ncbi:MAG: glyoxylase-like metal-dependent hydrolase (beta-lactamase superfamily II) [Arenicella sp.]|jgi:glyoxylase-like metal-dependent hydrolase (beta-lactamase superfamily II)
MKWILRVLIGVLFLLGIVIAAILLPAHIQVRSVTPALPSNSELLALRGTFGPDKVSYIITSSQQLERGQISHISIVVEWSNGKRFLIDTGMSKREAESFAKLLKKMDSSAGSVTVYSTVSETLGSEINDIAGVGFTHLHSDHTQGIENFCALRGEGAALLQTPSQRDLHNFNTSAGAELLESSCLERFDLVPESGANLASSAEFPGIAAFELGGHTPGSTLWAVSIGDKVLLFSGDTSNDKLSIERDIDKPTLYSYVFVPENTKRTAELRRWLNQLDKSEQFSVIVSHDLANTRSHLAEFVRK